MTSVLTLNYGVLASIKLLEVNFHKKNNISFNHKELRKQVSEKVYEVDGP